MATIISKRKLAAGDFDNWKARFESAAAARKAAGCRGVRRFRSADNPDEVIVVFDWDTLDNARHFIENNVRLLQAQNPAAPPMMETWYVEELEPLPS